MTTIYNPAVLSPSELETVKSVFGEALASYPGLPAWRISEAINRLWHPAIDRSCLANGVHSWLCLFSNLRDQCNTRLSRA